MKNIRG